LKLRLLHKNQTDNIHYSYFEGEEFLKLWHYHPEVELVYIASGKGTLYVGDFIREFKKNNIFLIGSNIPHMFESDGSQEKVSISKVIHLNVNFLKKIASIGDEFKYLDTIIQQSKLSLNYCEDKSKKLKSLFSKLETASLNLQILLTFQIIQQLASDNNVIHFGNLEWLDHIKMKDDRMHKVIQFIMMNFKHQINLDEVATMVAMNKTAFCRYFKQHTNLTFTNYLNGVRINYACKLLREKNGANSVSVACYNSGFNSLSYFSRIFKKNVGCSPSEY